VIETFEWLRGISARWDLANSGVWPLDYREYLAEPGVDLADAVSQTYGADRGSIARRNAVRQRFTCIPGARAEGVRVRPSVDRPPRGDVSVARMRRGRSPRGLGETRRRSAAGRLLATLSRFRLRGGRGFEAGRGRAASLLGCVGDVRRRAGSGAALDLRLWGRGLGPRPSHGVFTGDVLLALLKGCLGFV